MYQHFCYQIGIKGKPLRNIPHTSLHYVILKMGPPWMLLCPRGDQVLIHYVLASNAVFKRIDGHLARIILPFLKMTQYRIHTF